MSDLQDVDVETISDLVIDGANRLGSSATGVAASSFMAFVVASVLLAAMMRRGESRLTVPVALALALFFAVPGFSLFLARRADAPGRADVASARVARFASGLESFARGHGCAAVVQSSCAACDPVVRFAMATIPPCASPAPVVLYADALDEGCAEQGGAFVCGTPH